MQPWLEGHKWLLAILIRSTVLANTLSFAALCGVGALSRPGLRTLFITPAIGGSHHALYALAVPTHLGLREAADALRKRADTASPPTVPDCTADAPPAPPWPSKPLKLPLRRYFLPEHLSESARGTQWQYNTRVNQFHEWAGSDFPVGQVTDDVAAAFRAATLERGCSKRTAKNYFVAVRTMVRHAHNRPADLPPSGKAAATHLAEKRYGKRRG